MATRAARNQKAYRERRKAKLALLKERWERGSTLSVEAGDLFGIQEIKLRLDADAQEAAGELAQILKVDVHEFMQEQLSLNLTKLERLGKLKRLSVGGGE